MLTATVAMMQARLTTECSVSNLRVLWMSGTCCCVQPSAVRQAASARGASFPYRAHERCHAPYAVLHSHSSCQLCKPALSSVP